MTSDMNRSYQGKSHWPPALRRRLGIPKVTRVADGKDGNDQSVSGNDPLSAHQLRSYIHDGYAKMTSIQRQLHRGEESYFEDSYAHRGNLFSGWENIWIDPHGGSSGGADKADTSSSSSKPGQPQSMAKISVKRMPAEFRWFSSSCKSVNPMDGQILALDRPSLINQPPTPEPQPREGATGGKSQDHGSTMEERRDEVKGDNQLYQTNSTNAQTAKTEVVTSSRDEAPQDSGVTAASTASLDTKGTSADEELVAVVQSDNAAAARRDPIKMKVSAADRAPPQCRGGDDPPSQLALLATKEAEASGMVSNSTPSGSDQDKLVQSESQDKTSSHTAPEVEDKVKMATAQQLVPNPLNSVDYKVESAADTSQSADLPSKDESDPAPAVKNSVLEPDGRPEDAAAKLETKNAIDEKGDPDPASPAAPAKLSSSGSRRTSSRRKRKAAS